MTQSHDMTRNFKVQKQPCNNNCNQEEEGNLKFVTLNKVTYCK